MTDIPPDTWGWTVKCWNNSGGCIGQWFRLISEAFDFAIYEESKRTGNTTKIEIIRVQKRNSMRV